MRSRDASRDWLVCPKQTFSLGRWQSNGYLNCGQVPLRNKLQELKLLPPKDLFPTGKLTLVKNFLSPRKLKTNSVRASLEAPETNLFSMGLVR